MCPKTSFYFLVLETPNEIFYLIKSRNITIGQGENYYLKQMVFNNKQPYS